MKSSNSTQQRKSKVISVSLNDYQITKAKRLADDGPFSSVSDVISVALTEFIVRHELPGENIGAKIVMVLNQTKEGQQVIRSIYEQDWVEHDNVTASHICLDVKESIDSYLESTDGRALIRSVIMEAFTPTDAAHMKESKKNGNRPIIVDDIIE